MSTLIVAVADALPAQPEMAMVLVTVCRSPIATGVELVLASQPPPTALTVHVNVAEPVLPAESVTVAVTVEVPGSHTDLLTGEGHTDRLTLGRYGVAVLAS